MRHVALGLQVWNMECSGEKQRATVKKNDGETEIMIGRISHLSLHLCPRSGEGGGGKNAPTSCGGVDGGQFSRCTK